MGSKAENYLIPSGLVKDIEIKVGINVPISSGKLSKSLADVQRVDVTKIEVDETGQVIQITVRDHMGGIHLFGLHEFVYSWQTASDRIEFRTGQRLFQEGVETYHWWPEASTAKKRGWQISSEQSRLREPPELQDVKVAYYSIY